MSVDHLGELLNDVVEGVVVATAEVVRPDLLIQRSKSEASKYIEIILPILSLLKRKFKLQFGVKFVLMFFTENKRK